MTLPSMTATIHCGSPARSMLRSPNTASAAIAACARRSTFLRANYASSLNACAAPARRRSQSSRPAALTEWPHGKKLRNTLSSLKGCRPPRDRCWSQCRMGSHDSVDWCPQWALLGYSRCQLFAERCHRGLARRLVAVRRRAVLMMPKGERTQPRRALRRCHRLHDPTNHGAVGKHVEVVAVPLAGWAAQIA